MDVEGPSNVSSSSGTAGDTLNIHEYYVIFLRSSSTHCMVGEASPGEGWQTACLAPPRGGSRYFSS